MTGSSQPFVPHRAISVARRLRSLIADGKGVLMLETIVGVTVLSVLAEAVERVGADRLMWGTDMPMVARFCTYRQALDHIRVHCDFLTDAQRQAILGGTAARLMAMDMAPGGTR